MQASTLHGDVMVKRVPGGQLDLSHLTDKEVLSETRRLVGHSNHLFAALLVHLAEVESRGLHRQRACSSLYTYCIYELRMSEDAAARRSAAARWVRKFPALREAIARGELHLTGLLMIAPHLTEANQQEVLARARYRTKKELGRLVRELHPLPPVPDSMEPIRLVPKSPRNSSWELYMAALAGPVRKLKPGEHPHEWATEPAPRPNATVANDASMPPVAAGPSDVNAPSGVPSAEDGDPLPPAPPRHLLPPITGPQQYQLQFCTSEEHAELVERAKALLAKSRPGLSLGELHLMAMKLLVAQLERKKFAVTDRRRRRCPDDAGAVGRDQTPDGTHQGEGGDDAALGGVEAAQSASRYAAPAKSAQDAPGEQTDPRADGADDTRQRGADAHGATGRDATGRDALSKDTRQRGRHIPAAVRREAYRRDERRCTFVDERGVRCQETHLLELHHIEPFARRGPDTAANLTLRCAAHNALAAEHEASHERESEQRPRAALSTDGPGAHFRRAE